MASRASPRGPVFRRARALLLALALGVGLPGAAHAQSAEDRTTARLLAEQADKKLASKDYQGAADLFAQAYQLVPAPTLRLAQGRAELALGHLILAQQHMLEAARSLPQPGEPAPWTAARQKASTEAAAIDARLATLELSLTAPPGAVPSVSLDGQPLKTGTEGVPRAVDPGSHTVHVEAAGLRTVDQNLSLAEGERRKVTISLEANAPPPPVPPPSPEPAPASTPPPPPATIQEPAQPPPSEPAPKQTSGSLALSITGFAVAGASLIAGGALGIASLSSTSDIKSQCNGNNCPASLASQADSAKLEGTLSTVCFILVVPAVALGIFTLPRETSGASPAAPSAGVSLSIGPGSFGASGRF